MGTLNPGTVVVTGASSQLGVFLLPRLQAAEFTVLALSRKAPAAPVEVAERVRWQQYGQAVGPARHMVSCGPLEIACGLAAQITGLERVVAFSSSSVLTKAHSKNHDESRQMAKMRADEQRLAAKCEQLGIALALIRPTLIYGCGLDRNISLMAAIGRRFGLIPVASSAAGLRQPVHADDLAALAVSCLLNPGAIRFNGVACGGSALSYRDMMEKTAVACGAGVRIVTISTALLALAAGLASFLPGLSGVNSEMVRRQSRDMVFDDSEIRKAVDYDPRPFEPRPDDLQTPDFARKLQLRV